MKTPFNELVKTLLHQYSILEKKEDEEEDISSLLIEFENLSIKILFAI